MGLYSEAPDVVAFTHIKPTLIVCWWISIFCLVIILLRIAGRFIRSEQLFTEDRIVGFAAIPMFLRMGCVHVILTYGTNNVDFGSVTPSAQDVRHRQIASGLVLVARILHAATLWVLKFTILEFFRRISDAVTERFSEVALKIIRCIMLATFIAIVISDLAECRPFTHYWQVLPDPGGQCRQGYAQLLTVTACNVITDLLLVLLPIRIILQSGQTIKRKVQLSLLFSLSLGVVGVTIYRAKRVIEAHGDQQLRSLLASVELLFATAAANTLVLGSFVRDRGTKKNKYRNNSTAESVDRGSANRSRRPTANRHWGSDEDLVRDLGLGVERSLRDARDSTFLEAGAVGASNPTLRVDDASTVHGPNGPNAPNAAIGHDTTATHAELEAWDFPGNRRSGAMNSARSGESGTSGISAVSGQSDDDSLLRDPLGPSLRHAQTRKVSFYEALAAENALYARGTVSVRELDDDNVHGTALYAPGSRPAQDGSFSHSPPAAAYTASSRGVRRGSTALLSDMGGFLGPPTRHRSRASDAKPPGLQTVPQGSSVDMAMPRSLPPMQRPDGPGSSDKNMTLIDAGGLLR